MKNNTQKWRKNMGTQDIGVFEAITGDLLTQYGYELFQEPTDPLAPSQILYYRYLKSPLLKSIAMLKKSKGQRDALIDFETSNEK
jgi:hypothetical protein